MVANGIRIENYSNIDPANSGYKTAPSHIRKVHVPRFWNTYSSNAAIAGKLGSSLSSHMTNWVIPNTRRSMIADLFAIRVLWAGKFLETEEAGRGPPMKCYGLNRNRN